MYDASGRMMSFEAFLRHWTSAFDARRQSNSSYFYDFKTDFTKIENLVSKIKIWFNYNFYTKWFFQFSKSFYNRTFLEIGT